VSPSSLRLASYNIHKSVGLDGRRDPGRIIDVVNQVEADVVVLQEVDRRLGSRPSTIDRHDLDLFTDFQVADLARNDVSLGWHGNAVLVRKGLTIHDVAHIELPGLEPRGAVEVRVGAGDRMISIVGAHLGLLRPFRKAQLARIREHLEAGDIQDSVVLGDFNEWSATAGFEALDGAFDMVSPGKSFHSGRPISCLDRIALGRGVELVDAGVEQGQRARVASDHLPIWGDVVLRRTGRPKHSPARSNAATPGVR